MNAQLLLDSATFAYEGKTVIKSSSTTNHLLKNLGSLETFGPSFWATSFRALSHLILPLISSVAGSCWKLDWPRVSKCSATFFKYLNYNSGTFILSSAIFIDFSIVIAQLLLGALFLLKYSYYDSAIFIRCTTFIRYRRVSQIPYDKNHKRQWVNHILTLVYMS